MAIETQDPRAHPLAVVRAWFAHLITATGAVFGLMALVAIMREEWRLALLWMAAAVAVDSADGAFARWAQVKSVLPGFDGALLDNLLDYLNYVVVPAFFLYAAALLPARWGGAAAVAIVLSSAYQFCRADAKTPDHYFTGFPSYWNVVAMYVFLLRPEPWLSVALITFLCVMTFVPVRYVYPSRTRAYRLPTLVAASAWGLLSLLALVQYPAHSPLVVWASLLFVPYYVAISVLARQRERGGV